MSHNVIFMGTPHFAVPALTALHKAYNVIAVVTQPDRPSGRGRKVIPSAVKVAAEALNLPVLQPRTLKNPEAFAQLETLQPDLIVVAAFGQILRSNVLNLPSHGCVNVHASLLPRWRGAAPVAAAIRAGDDKTGITLMRMDKGLDTGPMLGTKSIAIEPHHTRESLTADLADLGAELLTELLPAWFNGLTPTSQDDSLATLAPRIKKQEGEINWHQTAEEIERHTRAFYPWPGTFTSWQDTIIKILDVEVVPDWTGSEITGAVFWLGKEIAVATGKGAIILNSIKPAGKREMSADSFARGATDFIGSQFQ